MADITSVAPKSTLNIGRVLSAPFRAIGNALIAMAEAGPRMARLRRLSELTDAQLEARGTTRQEQLRRILGASIY